MAEANQMKGGRYVWLFTSLTFLLGILTMLDLHLGSVEIPFADFILFLSGGKPDNLVIYSILDTIRLPKTITAILAGSALSVSGLLMQTIFRNPLAGPYVLGISSGASLGVALVVLGFSSIAVPVWFSQIGVVASAMLGSMGVLLIVLAVSVRVKDIMTILILGMMFGSAASAIVSILQYFSTESTLRSYVMWTLGSLGNVTGSQLWVFGALVFLGLLIALVLSKYLNVILLGENYARNLGLKVSTVRFLVFLSTSILTGSVTAYCGPIAFVGIAVPHLVRMIFGTSNHHVLIPATVLSGASIVLLCDIISQLPGSDLTFPINSVASLLGIPVVVYVVIKNKRFSST